MRLKASWGPQTGPLHGDGKNAAVLLGARDVVTEQMLHEAVDGGESAVPGGRGVAAVSLEVIQEGQHDLMTDVLEAQLRCRTTDVIRQK